MMAMLMVMITMILTEIGGDEFYRMENTSIGVFRSLCSLFSYFVLSVHISSRILWDSSSQCFPHCFVKGSLFERLISWPQEKHKQIGIDKFVSRAFTNSVLSVHCTQGTANRLSTPWRLASRTIALMPRIMMHDEPCQDSQRMQNVYQNDEGALFLNSSQIFWRHAVSGGLPVPLPEIHLVLIVQLTSMDQWTTGTRMDFRTASPQRPLGMENMWASSSPWFLESNGFKETQNTQAPKGWDGNWTREMETKWISWRERKTDLEGADPIDVKSEENEFNSKHWHSV